ncbi:MAG: HD family phosphohydrolase [Kangiella sp.]|nr:MAG: HD family phosphohydrolase [Kangiella sp.]
MNEFTEEKDILIVGDIQTLNISIQTHIKSLNCSFCEDISEIPFQNKFSCIVFCPQSVFTTEIEISKRGFFYLSFSNNVKGDIGLSHPPSLAEFKSNIASALAYHQARINLRKVEKLHLLASKERENLSAIGIALSAEKDLDKLLTLVLKEGRSLGRCEGASLYLIGSKLDENGKPKATKELVFKLTQNSKISFDFKEARFSLTNRSLAGYVALTGEILNIQDVYKLDASYPFSFDKSFDEKVGYRSKELLVLPMKNHKGRVIGVLQFVNNFGQSAFIKDELPTHDIGFSKLKQGLLEGLASQAAVAIDNSNLIENIQNLFEGFVSASVNAIESRDPATSGHSFRVAELTTGLAKMVDKEVDGLHKDISFNKEQLQEIRYASLLHDFGKVGVKENVLLKANKLHHSRFQYLELKLDWQKQMLEKEFFRQIFNEARSGYQAGNKQQDNNLLDTNYEQSSAYKDLCEKLQKLDDFKALLAQANKPSILEESVAGGLSNMADYSMHPEFPYANKLISPSDFLSLSISKGSLTEKERAEIQSHVTHTQTFLERIPWTDELAGIPRIAGAHHEKLDGTGYPFGLKRDQIPLPSKIMTIADIYDALTAQDRPYKKALPIEIALDILNDEAKKGKIEKSLLNTFIESKVYNCILD